LRDGFVFNFGGIREAILFVVRILTVLAVAIACVIPNASAQNATGRIIGNITDPSGAAILDAKVTVTNVATQVSRETSTDADGYFQVLDLPSALIE